jgi:integrating conjugative element protein (TIGR03765 family)
MTFKSFRAMALASSLLPCLSIADPSEHLEPIASKAPPGMAMPHPNYPVHTGGISPGKLEVREMPANAVAIPFFLVGADSLSREWLVRNRDRLSRLGAYGILVDADSELDLRAIAELAPNLPITPLDVTDMARILRISRYPALISSGRIEQ